MLRTQICIILTLAIFVQPFILPTPMLIPNQVDDNTLVIATGRSLGNAFSQHYFQVFSADQLWGSAVYSGLLRPMSEDWDLELAQSVEKVTINSSDAIQVVLKPNLRFSNGNALTAEDVVFSYKVALTPEIEQYKYDQISSLLLTNSTIQQVNDDVLIFYVDEINVHLNSLLSYGIIDQEVFQLRYDNCIAGNTSFCNWNDPSGADAISAGPYILQSLDSESAVLEKNPNYFRSDKISIDNVLIQHFTSNVLATQQLDDGILDVVDPYLNLNLQTINGNTYLSIVQDSDESLLELGINLLHPVFGTGENIPGNNGTLEDHKLNDALLVRTAIYQITNRQHITSTIFNNNEIIAETPMPTSKYSYQFTASPYQYSINSAKQKMEDAGFNFNTISDIDSDGLFETFFFNITLITTPVGTNSQNTLIGQQIAEDLKRIGIGVSTINHTIFVEPYIAFWKGGLPKSFDEGGFDLVVIRKPTVLTINWEPRSYYTSEGRCDVGSCLNYYNFDLNATETNTSTFYDSYYQEFDTNIRKYHTNLFLQEIYNYIPFVPISHKLVRAYHNVRITGVDAIMMRFFNFDWINVEKVIIPINDDSVSSPLQNLSTTNPNQPTTSNQENVTHRFLEPEEEIIPKIIVVLLVVLAIPMFFGVINHLRKSWSSTSTENRVQDRR